MVLGILGFMMFMFLPSNSTLMSNKAREVTLARLKNIEVALVNYVVVNKRLPCPALGTLAAGAVNAGSEVARDANGDCSANQASGVIPYTTLGLTLADVEDDWNMLPTYRVGFGLTRNNSLDMSMCDPAGTGTTNPAPPGVATDTSVGACLSACVNTDLSTCTSPQNFLFRKGLNVQDSTNNLLMNREQFGGAAYVLISHGQNTHGGYSRDGVYRSGVTGGVIGDLEAVNINGADAAQTIVATPGTAFRDGGYSDTNAVATYFDDLVIRPSLIAVIQKAQLGPRSH